MKKTIFLFVILLWLGEIANAKGNINNWNIFSSVPPCTFTVTTTIFNVSCLGGTGEARAFPSGGTSPYTYSWLSTGQTSYNAILTAGTYIVNITDINGCTGSATVTITQPPLLSTTYDTLSATGGNCNGSAWITASGGTLPYTYSWTSGLTTDTIKNLCTGSYICTVIDAHGCSSSVSATINNYTGINELGTTREEIQVFPNPNNGKFILAISNINEKCTLEIFNYLGVKVISEPLPQMQNSNINLTEQPNGIYLYRVLKEDSGWAGDGKIVIEK
jgi:hypothetical protein